MNIIDKVLNFTRITLLGIALCFLVIPYPIEVNADNDRSYRDPIEDPPEPPRIPNPPEIPEPPKGDWMEYGRCTVDYADNVWGAILWALIKRFLPKKDRERLEFGHHDVYIARYPKPPGPDDREYYEKNGYEARGFFATGEDLDQWKRSLEQWKEYGIVVYVEGEMRDTHREYDLCEIYLYGWERGIEDAHTTLVLQRYEEEWSDFHIVRQNCQHWAFWVLTGRHLSESDS